MSRRIEIVENAMSDRKNEKSQTKQPWTLEATDLLEPILPALQEMCVYETVTLFAGLPGKALKPIIIHHITEGGKRPHSKVSNLRLPDTDLLSEIIQKREPEIISIKSKEPEHHMVFPLSVPNGGQACYVISRKSSRPFTNSERREAGSLCANISLALQNYMLLETLHEKEEALHAMGELLSQTQGDLDKAVTIAEKSLNTRKNFLSRMNHELRTPINGVLGLTHLLLSTPHSDEHAEYLHNIKASGERLLSLVNNILDVADIENAKLGLEQILFNPAELIKAILDSPEVKAVRKNLRVDLALNLPKNVIGDPIRLNQIMINLITNAFKFTEEGFITIKGEVSRTEDDMVWVRFTIRDTGMGIPAKKMSSIFDIVGIPDNTDGAGFGLYLVRHIVEIQNGIISVRSQPGKGSEFVVEIPYKTHSPNGKKNHTDVELKPFRNVKILLAEDNAVNQMVATRTLEKWNINVTIATNGREALEKLRQHSFDMVIMDIQMPEMDGIEAAGTIRESFPEPVKNIPIMAMTACLSEDSLEDFKRAGINDHLAKPFRPQELYKKISQLLAR